MLLIKDSGTFTAPRDMPGAKFVGLAHVQQNRALGAAALRDQVVDFLSAKETW